MYIIWKTEQSLYHKQEVLGCKTVHKGKAIQSQAYDKALAKIKGNF